MAKKMPDAYTRDQEFFQLILEELRAICKELSRMNGDGSGSTEPRGEVICGVCQRSFKTAQALQVHSRSHKTKGG